MVEFGSVVVTGNDISEIIEKALEIASTVEGYKVEFNAAALPEAINDLNKIQQILNVKF